MKNAILCVRKRRRVYFLLRWQSQESVSSSTLSALCKWQSTWQDVNCPYALNLNHMAGLNLRLPSELPSWQWQQRYRVSVRALDPRCSRPGGHTGRARWPADQEVETGRCRHGRLNHRQREQRQQSEQGQVIFVSYREVSYRKFVLVSHVTVRCNATNLWSLDKVPSSQDCNIQYN